MSNTHITRVCRWLSGGESISRYPGAIAREYRPTATPSLAIAAVLCQGGDWADSQLAGCGEVTGAASSSKSSRGRAPRALPVAAGACTPGLFQILVAEQFLNCADDSPRRANRTSRRLAPRARATERPSDVGAALQQVSGKTVSATRRELFSRLVFNILCGNPDDHARNHADFWDGRTLSLTSALSCLIPRF